MKTLGILAVLLTVAVAQRWPPPPHHRGRHPPPPWERRRGRGGGGGGRGGSTGRNTGDNGGGRGINRGGWGSGRGGASGGQGRNFGSSGNEVRDGSGECRTQLSRVTSTYTDYYGRDMNELEERVANLIQRYGCQRPTRGGPPGRGQCTSDGKCDTQRQRIESMVHVGKRTYTIDGQRYKLLITNGIPNHCYEVDEQRPTPNSACEHYSAILIPQTPNYRSSYRDHGMGPVGIAISGAYFYNHKSAEPGCNVAAISEAITFDPCDGHSDPSCRYHYHKAPVCIGGWDECGLMGYMKDGYPVFGKCRVRFSRGNTIQMTSKYSKINRQSGCSVSHYYYDRNSQGSLDQANGFYFEESARAVNGNTTFPAGTYAYFFTPEFPFIMPGTFSSRSNNHCFFSPNDL